MPTISDVISRYDSICAFCDSFWNKAVIYNSGQIHCHIGCSDCCELETVSAIEAFKIIMHIGLNAHNYSSTDYRYCTFLENNKCRIYSCRPVICRTHGLLLKSGENSCVQSCPCNFKDCKTSDHTCILDWESLTMNLMKINMAFCTLAGFPELASERILLSDIASGKIPDKLTLVLSSL